MVLKINVNFYGPTQAKVGMSYNFENVHVKIAVNVFWFSVSSASNDDIYYCYLAL